MPQQILVPWVTVERPEGRTPWIVYSGQLATVLQAADGLNEVYQVLNYGQNDTNSLDGSDWRQPGGGAFSWAGKTPTRTRVEWMIYNFGPSNAFGMASYLADVPQTWYVEMINSSGVFLAPNAWTWVDLGYTANPNVLAAIAANNLHATLIFYNHTGGTQQIAVDCVRLTVDYSGGGAAGMPWTEI